MKHVAIWMDKYRLWWKLGIPVALAVAFHLWSKAPLGWMMFAFLVVLPAVGHVITADGGEPIWHYRRDFWGELLFRISLSGIGFAIDDGLFSYSAAMYLAMAAVGTAIALVAIRSGRVARGTRDKHPFDGMPLEDGEGLVLKKLNGNTDHLTFAIAVSDRALYIRPYRVLMPPAWQRFDISSIRGLRIRELRSLGIDELRGRTELLILQEKRSDSVRTPSDMFAYEKERDRRIMREALAVLEQFGVPVTDECPPPDVTRRSGPTPVFQERGLAFVFQERGLAFAAAVVACFAYYSALSNLPNAFFPKGSSLILALALVLLALPVVLCALFHYIVVRDSELSKLRQWVQIAGAAFFAPGFGWLLALSVYGKSP